jgi:hypothetical protein
MLAALPVVPARPTQKSTKNRTCTKMPRSQAAAHAHALPFVNMPMTEFSRAALFGVFRGVPFPTPIPLYLGLIDTTGAEIQGCDRVPAPAWTDPTTDADGVTTMANATAVFFDLSKVPAPPNVPATTRVGGWVLWDACQGGNAWLTATFPPPCFDPWRVGVQIPTGGLTITMSGGSS